MEKAFKKRFVILMLPTLIAFIIAFIIPFVLGIYLSFTKFTTVTDAQWIGLSNYIVAFRDKDFLASLLFTVKFVLVNLVTINLIAFMLAYVLSRKLRGTNIFRTVIFMPNLLGGLALGYIWQFIFEIVFSKILFGEDGIISIPALCNMTQDNTKALFALVMLITWQMAGYMMIIYTTGLNNIPKDLSEAAAIDGAGTWQRFKSITVPMLMPSFTIVFFLTLSKCFMLLDQNVALTDGNFSTRMLAMQILYTTRDGSPPDYGLAQAQAVIFFVLIAAVTLVQVSITSKKEVEL